MKLLLPMLLSALGVAAQDQVTITNAVAGQANGLIVWGKHSDGSCAKVFTSATTPVDIGDVTIDYLLGCKTAEVVGFTAGKAPGYAAATFSASSNTVSLTYTDVVNLKVKVWVVCATAACATGTLTPTMKTDIMAKLTTADLLLLDQNAGVRLDLSDPNLISDQTGNAAAKAYKDFNCGMPPGAVTGMLDKDALNLYLMKTVEVSKKDPADPTKTIVVQVNDHGDTCWLPNVAWFGTVYTGGLFAHEIGHNLRLRHAEESSDLSAAGGKNIMWSEGPAREYFSEGEIYRMHLDRFSVLNRVNATYSNPPRRRTEARDCTAKGAVCASLGTRIWIDP